jgi:hypothetical protein
MIKKSNSKHGEKEPWNRSLERMTFCRLYIWSSLPMERWQLVVSTHGEIDHVLYLNKVPCNLFFMPTFTNEVKIRHMESSTVFYMNISTIISTTKLKILVPYLENWSLYDL